MTRDKRMRALCCMVCYKVFARVQRARSEARCPRCGLVAGVEHFAVIVPGRGRYYWEVQPAPVWTQYARDYNRLVFGKRS